MDNEDWDLHAVVRGCAAAPSKTIAAAINVSTNTDPFPNFTPLPFHQSPFDDVTGFVDDKNTNPFQGLQEVYQELCGDYPLFSAAVGGDVTPTAAAQGFQSNHGTTLLPELVNPTTYQMNMKHDIQLENPGFGFVSHTSSSTNSNPQSVRPRRRKNQQLKMVRQMTQEELSADSWAWRKYGQKPIKGSPYPRNYYRCSTSKGCAARKQVERSPEDPAIFIVSYTGEHTHPKPSHRSSLAGSTRNKLETKSNNNNVLLHQRGTASIISSSSSPASSSSFSPCPHVAEVKENEDTENLDDGDDDDNDIGMNDDDEYLMSNRFEDSDDHDDLGGGGDHLFAGGNWQ